MFNFFIAVIVFDVGLFVGSGHNELIQQPKFSAPIVNLSIAVGRDATFKCLVHHLGKYKVGWVKADTKAIQAIDKTVITHNSRVTVSHEEHGVWNLHIRDVKEEDRGVYMCQINTDPMTSQLGILDVLHPPDFIESETSGDTLASEGSTVNLRCSAKGRPPPRVLWKREDNRDIVVRTEDDRTIKVQTYQGEVLKLLKISRNDMGAYLCIASNGVPPTISKRIVVLVHFSPVIHVPNQLVGAPLGTYVTLECHVQSSPIAFHYWLRDTGEILSSNEKYEVQIIKKSIFEVRMLLTVKKILHSDLGTYQCVAKNSLGEVDSNIRLYEISGLANYASLFNNDAKNDLLSSKDKEETILSNGVKIRHSKQNNDIRTEISKMSKLNYIENYVPTDQNLSPVSISGTSSKSSTIHFLADIFIFFNLYIIN